MLEKDEKYVLNFIRKLDQKSPTEKSRRRLDSGICILKHF